jgi:hypothetical protein
VLLRNKMRRNYVSLPTVEKPYKEVYTSNHAADVNTSKSLGLLHTLQKIILFVSFKSVIALTSMLRSYYITRITLLATRMHEYET